MRFAAIVISLVLASCNIYVRPITRSSPVTHHHSSGTKTTSSKRVISSGNLVDSDWLTNYYKLEREHGNYTIPADHGVVPVGDKFRVSKEMTDHLQDMSRARIPVPSTTPNQEFNP